jgi:hypothetical protein
VTHDLGHARDRDPDIDASVATMAGLTDRLVEAVSLRVLNVPQSLPVGAETAER